MINLPYIPYIIFILIMIFGIYLGYKRGWRVAAYEALLSIVAFIISYGIFSIFYENIAEIISTLLYDKIGDPAYSWEDILVLGRPIIFTVAVSVMYMPMLLFLWLVTYPLYKELNKKNYPKELKKISSNERIIEKPHLKTNKLGGIMVGALSTTITASIVTSAVAAVFVSSSNFTTLFSITDAISSIISGGNLGNPIAYQYLYDFLPYTRDVELMESLSILIRPNHDSLINQSQIDKLNEDDHKKALKNVLSNPESTKALLDTIDQKGNGLNWLPLEVLDDPSFAPTASALDNLLADNLSLGLSKVEITNLIDWMVDSAIQDFEETRFYKEWKDAETLRKEEQGVLASMMKDMEQMITDIKSGVTDYNLLISEIETYITEHNAKLSQIPSLTLDKDEKETKELAERSSRDSLETTYNNKKSVKDTLYATYISEKGIYDNHIQQRDSNESYYKKLDAEIVELEKDITSLESEITGWTNERTSKESEHTTLVKDRDSKELDRNDALYDYQVSETDADLAQSEYDIAKSDLDSAKSAWDNAGNPTGNDPTFQAYERALSNEKTKSDELNNANKLFDDNKKKYEDALNDYEEARDKVTSIESDISALTNNINSNRVSIASNELSIQSKKYQSENAFRQYESHRDAAILQKPIMDDAEDDFDVANSEYNTAKSNYDKQYAIWESAYSSWEYAKNLLDTTQQRIDELDLNVIPSTDSDITSKYNDIDTLYQNLSNIKYEEVKVSNIDDRFKVGVDINGGNGSNWTIAKPAITKMTYVEDSSTWDMSIPYQEEYVEQLLITEDALKVVRDEKNEEFDENIVEYINTLTKVLG